MTTRVTHRIPASGAEITEMLFRPAPSESAGIDDFGDEDGSDTPTVAPPETPVVPVTPDPLPPPQVRLRGYTFQGGASFAITTDKDVEVYTVQIDTGATGWKFYASRLPSTGETAIFNLKPPFGLSQGSSYSLRILATAAGRTPGISKIFSLVVQ